MSESLFPPPAPHGLPSEARSTRRRRWPWVILVVALVLVATIVVAASISALRPTPSCGCSGPTRPSPTVSGAALYAALPTALRPRP
jgi:hypothetical protein